jgi:hypothetical protein
LAILNRLLETEWRLEKMSFQFAELLKALEERARKEDPDGLEGY